MKRVAAILLAICWAGIICIVVPAPNLRLLPFTIAAPELAPWLAGLNLCLLAVAVSVQRRLALFVVPPLLVTVWPLAQIAGVRREIERQLPEVRRPVAARGEITPVVLPLNIHLYQPHIDGARPAVIDIYGGAWQRGTPKDNRKLDSYLAARGYAVFAIDYRHAPAARFPAQLDDVRAALAYIRENAARYRTDPQRLVLCGESAGAQLALLAAYEPGPAPATAVISFYGPTDLASGYSDVPFPDPLDVRAVLRTYLGGTPSEVPERYRAASPVMYVRASLPPTLLIQGRRDHIVKPRFARELQKALLAKGNRAVLVELPWAEHAFDAVFGGIGIQLGLDAVERFLQEI